MMKKVLLFLSFFVPLTVSAQVNSLSISGMTVNPGDQVSLPVMMNNEGNVVGVSFTLNLSDGITVALDEDNDAVYALNSTRVNANKFSVTAVDNADGSWGFRLYTTSGSGIIKGTEGEIMSITLNVAENFASGDHTVSLTDNKLSVRADDNSVSSVPVADAQAAFTVTGSTDVHDQSVSLTSLPVMTYGDASYTLPATTDQGLTLTWTSSNAEVATVSGNILEVVKPGSATITAVQEGNDSYNAFSREYTLTVSKAVLTVTAGNCSKVQWADNPPLQITYSGFKNDDDASSLTVQPTVSTEATKDSPEGVYPITVSGGESDNYEFNYVNGTLTVIKADQSLTLADAITNAEGKALGFEKDQYAPYINAEVLETLAYAKEINTDMATAAEIIAATAAIGDANWTANTTDVDAIYNGSFATVAEGQNYPDGWTRTNGWGQQQTGLTGDYATAYYNQPGSLQYGNQGVYTMPLAANTAYKLTFAYRSHESNSNNGMTVSVLNGEDGLVETDFPANGSTSEWKVVSKRFKTGAAGNYVLTLANSGNTWITNVSLVKAEVIEMTISEEDGTTPKVDPLANVTLTRTLKGGQWNSFSVPFGFTVTGSALDGAEVKQFASANGNEITLEDATAIVAGEPYLVKPASDIVNPVFYNVTVGNPDEAVKGTGVYTFQAHLYNTSLATDGSVAYVSTTDSSIKKLTSGGLKGLRAYFNIPTGSNVKPLNVNFGDGFATGILTVDTDGNIYEGTIYNLSGQRVNTMQKGIYIVNGKKIIVK